MMKRDNICANAQVPRRPGDALVRAKGAQGGAADDQKRSCCKEIIHFGAFRLHAAERLLEKEGVPVGLGSRALDILIALVERATDVVNKRDLIARVWPDLVVDEGSLRFHIAVLRKALGDGVSGARYVSNVPGRGYCFVAPVSRTMVETVATAGVAWDRPTNLPARPVKILGRDETVREVCSRLRSHRFVSVVGPGGMGKTTVAVSVAHAMRQEFGGAVYCLDLGARSGVSLPDLLRYFRNRRVLLVLDNCEPMIEAAGALAQLLFREGPRVHLLATSREPLRVQGEQVLHLPPLGCPPDNPPLKAADALAFPAVRLFVDCVAASGYAFELTDAQAPAVGEICRRLDGVALALELTAGRVGEYGIRGTAALLDSPFRLFWQGRRIGPSRHQTLSATLDWSYDLLSAFERLTLRRLSVFGGAFSLDAIHSVSSVDADRAHLTETIASLVEKSLVMEDSSATKRRYRLLETTRAYLLLKLTESGERQSIARRHAVYCMDFLERTNARAPLLCAEELLGQHAALVRDVRVALQWCFSEQGDVGMGTALAALAFPIFEMV